jgi:hypothetical protein
MCVTHILVDNPISHAAGREIYGFPKAVGRFDPPVDFLDKGLVIHGFGGDFGPAATASWVPVLELAPAGARPQVTGELEGPDALVEALLAELTEEPRFAEMEARGAVRLPGVRVAAKVINEARSGVMHQVFLKQFRDAADQRRACYQAVVEAIARTTQVKWGLSGEPWDVTIHPVDSHPLHEDLGVATQRARWSARLRDYWYEVDTGAVIAP